MARRLFNGRRFSENGWPYVDEGSCTWTTVPGADVTLQIQNGPPLALLRAWAADWNAYIEPLRDDDSACWTPGNSVATSNHPGGTAIDLNWESHPFQERGSLNATQMATLAEMEDFYEDNVFWAGRWDDPVDEMHSQVGYNTYDQDNDRPFPKVLDFIARKIRPDGYSTFRRGNAPSTPPAVDVLARATGLPPARAAQILPTMSDGLKQAECTTPVRSAQFIAHTGHESANFNATEEYASGAAYEGRCSDLGNCQPGDGVRFKGRTWIQITGRAHYAEFSRWAFDRGLVPSPTYFVDRPTELADLRWAGIGAAWYWTVSRPMNALVDAGENAQWGDYRGFAAVTAAINGGTTGIDDRRNRYNRAIALGDQLLTLTAPTEPVDQLKELLMSDPVPSLSIYATPGEPKIPPIELLRSVDAATHRGLIVEPDAELGDPDALDRMLRTAAGKGQYGTLPGPVNHAKAKLAKIAAQNPPALLYVARAAAAGDTAALGVITDIQNTNPAVLQAFLATQKGN